MPVMDDSFEAFVTNLGKYNAGELVGEWVKLPITAEEMKKVFDRIGIGSKDEFGQPYEEWFITDYECPIHGIYDMLGEYESLDKLNYFASRIDEMSDWEQQQFTAIMESGCDEVSTLDDLINLTFNLDSYDFIPDVHDESDLGYYYVHEAGIYSEKELGPLANYIDYERFGRDVAMDESGKFTDNGYVRSNGNGWTRMFDGTLDDIPDEYRITGSGENHEHDSMITVLVVEPMKEPIVKEIDSGLKSLQHEVGGSIEAVYPYDDPVALICDEEGKLQGKELNRALRGNDGDVYDVIAGTFLVTGLAGDNFGSLTPELANKFAEQFRQPEMFVRINGSIHALPVPASEDQGDAKTDIPTSTVDIYQLKDSPQRRDLFMESHDRLEKRGMKVDKANYDLIYSGALRAGESLESVYERFNLHHTADFRGHSLSVSDVIVVHEKGTDTAHYVDSIGFKELPEFLQENIAAVTLDTAGLAVTDHIGTWHTIEQTVVNGETYSLMEHDTYGDEAASIIIDSKGRLVLDEIYNGFDDDVTRQLELEQMQVAELPDTSISTDEMKDYGYAWGGMLPMREQAALGVLDKPECTVYKLFIDNTEARVTEKPEIADHAKKDGIFGVEKEAWVMALERENYLKSAEISTEDDYGMIDGIINNGPREEPKSEKSSIMERLIEARSDKAPEKTAPKKTKGDLEL